MLRSGDIVAGRYQVEELINQGSSGAVYRVRNADLDLPLALKVLHQTVPRAVLLREGQLLARLRHPNIVQVHDFLQLEGRPGLLMAYVPDTLFSLLERQEISPSTALLLSEQIVQGLAAAHLRGIIHQDLKPANILLRWRGRQPWALLCDFGLGGMAGASGAASSGGTPGYMAPEQYSGSRPVRLQTDIFSLGVILYELLTGARIAAHLQATRASPEALHALPLPNTLRPTLPEDLSALIRQAMSVDPEQRPRIDAFLALWDASTAPAPPTPTASAYTPTVAPAPSSAGRFFGRQAVLSDIAKRLSGDQQVQTILGLGGLGKTRLAQHFAQQQAHRFPGGFWSVDLVEVHTRGELLLCLAQLLHISAKARQIESAIGQALQGRGRCLILFDNAEQLVEPLTPLLAEWQQRAPEARFLVTSRLPLRLPGVEPLWLEPLPEADAAALFVDRMQQLHPTFRLDSATRPLVTEIVQRLEGISLSIELAAGWTRSLSLERLCRRLSSKRPLRATDRPARHQSMRQVLDDTMALLTETERLVLAGLGTFAGGFTLADACAVLQLDGAEQWAIEGLLEKNLLRTIRPGRWAPFEVVREHVMRADGGDRTTLRQRHAEHFARLGAPEAIDALRATDGLALHRALSEQLQNLTAACQWAVQNRQGHLAARLEGALHQIYLRTGPFDEDARLADRVLGMSSLTGTDRIAVLLDRAEVHRHMEELDQAITRRKEAAALLQEHPDRRLRCVLSARWIFQPSNPEYADDLALSREAVAICREAGLRLYEGHALLSSLAPLIRRGQFEAFHQQATEALAVQNAVGDLESVARTHVLRGKALTIQGALAEAEGAFQRADAILQDFQHNFLRANIRIALCVTLLNRGLKEASALTRAEALLQEAMGFARLSGSRLMLAVSTAESGMVSYYRNDWEEAALGLEEGIALLEHSGSRTVGSYQMLLAIVLSLLGEVESARERLATARTNLKPQRGSVLEMELWCVEGHIAWAAGDDEAARHAVEAAIAVRNQTGRDPKTHSGGGSIRTIQARIASGLRTGGPGIMF